MEGVPRRDGTLSVHGYERAKSNKTNREHGDVSSW